MADALIETAAAGQYEMVFTPGGRPGVDILAKDATVVSLLRKQKESQKWYCASGAAPALVLGKNNLIDDEYATAYPGFDTYIPRKEKFKEKIVKSHKCSMLLLDYCSYKQGPRHCRHVRAGTHHEPLQFRR